VNEGSDGTLEWLKDQGIAYTHSQNNVGICYALNEAAVKATGEYLVFMNDDMYVLPEWDTALVEAIETIGHTHFFLSATILEPVFTRNNCVIAPAPFGVCPESFDEHGLLVNYQLFRKKNWLGATWPPNVVHRSLWKAVGGYSVEFSPGMYSDPDFSMKLWHAGVRVFMGIGNSRVYHFMSKTTSRLHKVHNGKNIFLQKWGVSNSQFRRTYLMSGVSTEQKIVKLNDINVDRLRWKGHLKRAWYTLMLWI
jgi:glycosyltransferase involved in cell wall biosynthesis